MRTIVQFVLSNNSGTFVIIKVGETEIYIHGTKHEVLDFANQIEKAVEEQK